MSIEIVGFCFSCDRAHGVCQNPRIGAVLLCLAFVSVFYNVTLIRFMRGARIATSAAAIANTAYTVFAMLSASMMVVGATL